MNHQTASIPSSGVTPIVFAAGGTGGHLAPCLAIAEHLRDQLGQTPPCWVICSERDIDRRMLEPALAAGTIQGFTPIAARPFGLSPRTLFSLASNWGHAVAAARRAIRHVQHATAASESAPGVVAVSTGGFVGPPAMHAARVQGCRRVLINLDAVTGRAGRWLAQRVDLCLDAAPDASAAARRNWRPIGPMVRRQAQPLRPIAEARHALGLHPERPTLLVTGGSQGARSVNEFIAAHLAARADVWRAAQWQALHLAGGDDADRLRQAYADARVPAVVLPFLAEMGDAWSAADVHVGRAGAATVAEVWCARTPSLLLPYPYHADQHQRLNAARLVDEGIAIVATDQIDPMQNLRAHGAALETLMHAAAAAVPGPRRAAADPSGVVDALRSVGELGGLGNVRNHKVRKSCAM